MLYLTEDWVNFVHDIKAHETRAVKDLANNHSHVLKAERVPSNKRECRQEAEVHYDHFNMGVSTCYSVKASKGCWGWEELSRYESK